MVAGVWFSLVGSGDIGIASPLGLALSVVLIVGMSVSWIGCPFSFLFLGWAELAGLFRFLGCLSVGLLAYWLVTGGN